MKKIILIITAIVSIILFAYPVELEQGMTEEKIVSDSSAVSDTSICRLYIDGLTIKKFIVQDPKYIGQMVFYWNDHIYDISGKRIK